MYQCNIILRSDNIKRNIPERKSAEAIPRQSSAAYRKAEDEKEKTIVTAEWENAEAEEKEISDAINEKIEFLFQNNVVKIIGKNRVEQVELVKTDLIQRDGEERLVPINIDKSNYTIDADYIIMALGSKPENFISTLDLELNKWGNVQIDDNYQTSNKKIYAGGDLAGVKGTVAWAARSGREAAKQIVKNI